MTTTTYQPSAAAAERLLAIQAQAAVDAQAILEQDRLAQSQIAASVTATELEKQAAAQASARLAAQSAFRDALASATSEPADALKADTERVNAELSSALRVLTSAAQRQRELVQQARNLAVLATQVAINHVDAYSADEWQSVAHQIAVELMPTDSALGFFDLDWKREIRVATGIGGNITTQRDARTMIENAAVRALR